MATHFDLAGCQLGVDGVGRPTLNRARHADDPLGAEPLGRGQQRAFVPHDHLRDTGAIANVDKEHPAQIPDAMDPSEKHDGAADVGGAKSAAGMRTNEVA